MGAAILVRTAGAVLLLSAGLLGVFSANEAAAGSAESCLKTAETLRSQGRFEEAALSYRQGKEKAEISADSGLMVDCEVGLGVIDWNLGLMDSSSRYFQSALRMAQAADLRTESERCRTALRINRWYEEGKRRRISRDFKGSAACFEKALALADEIGSREHRLKCLRQMGLAFLGSSELDRFYDINRQALALARSLNHRSEEGKALNHLGIYHWKGHDFTRALGCYRQALEIARLCGDRADESAMLNNIGLIYKNVGSDDNALLYMMESVQIDRERMDAASVAIGLNNIGSVYVRRAENPGGKDDLHFALYYYLECLDLARQAGTRVVEVQVLNNLGTVFGKLRRTERALDCFNRAEVLAARLGDIETKAMAAVNRGAVLLETGADAEAESCLGRALELGLSISADTIVWEAFFHRGRLRERKGQVEEAEDCYEASLEVIDRLRSRLWMDTHQAGFIRNKMEVYERLLDLLFRTSDFSEADAGERMFHVVERAKARAFLEMVTESRNDLFSSLSPELQAAEQEVSARISDLVGRLRSGLAAGSKDAALRRLRDEEDRYESLLLRIRSENPALAGTVAPEPASLAEVREGLDDRTALVEYFMGRKRSYMLLVTRNRLLVRALPSSSEMADSLRGFLKLLSDPRCRDLPLQEAARRIYRELLLPLEEPGFEGLKNLVIVPDGILYRLPFEALRCGGRWLVERYGISYAPSGSSLLVLSRAPAPEPAPKILLAFADPRDTKAVSGSMPEENVKFLYAAEGFSLGDLPHARTEVRAISDVLPGWGKDVFIGREAGEGAFKSAVHRDYRIIHFACHGLLDEKRPFRSALVLAADTEAEDGILQVRELLKFRIPVELVVMSACSTGRGRTEPGEGVLGLPRVFFACGVRSVLSTLWMVGDSPTARLMEEFYRRLSQGLGKAEALRQAKISLIRSRLSHPCFWAGYVLYGEASSVLDLR